MSDEDPEESEGPAWQDLRPFYRSRPRQELTFVPPSSASAADTTPRNPNRAAEAYLSIVMKDKPPSGSKGAAGSGETSTGDENPLPATCTVCNLPLDGTGTLHEASLAHQVCLEHSHPPSHLDRKHVGLRYMSSLGWDPDARLGLGAEGTGIRAPIKTVKKNNTAGIGLTFGTKKTQAPVARKEMLDAGKVRKQYARDRKRDDKLRDMFYGDDKITRYLGGEK